MMSPPCEPTGFAPTRTDALCLVHPRPALVVPCAAGLEELLAAEMQQLLVGKVRLQPGSVWIDDAPDEALRLRWALILCLHTRLASRILWPLGRFFCPGRADLLEGATNIPFEDHLPEGCTFAVRCPRGAGELSHAHFAALCLKDAVLDRLCAVGRPRPDVDTHAPDVLFDLRFVGGDALISVDVAGFSLHERHRRMRGSLAPLKENLAAAMLLRSGFGPSPTGSRIPALVDPLCGSGTLLIEGALMAADIPAGLLRAPPARRWAQFDEALWQTLWQAAEAQASAGRKRLREQGWRAVGMDLDARQLRTAQAHIAKLGLDEFVQLVQGDAVDIAQHLPAPSGHLVTNLPYGQRLGSLAEARALYARLGAAWAPCAGWEAHVLVGDEELGFALGMRAHRRHRLYNGTLRVMLLHLQLGQRQAQPSAEAQQLRQRLQKNLARLRGQLDLHAPYRLYDADLPEFAAAVDVFAPAQMPKQPFVVVQEYAPPRHIPAGRARRHLRELREAVADVLQTSVERIIVKVRRPTKGGHALPAYEGEAPADDARFWVREAELQLWVELDQALDCGLFLDHRQVRARLRRTAAGKDVLNLFGYTGSLTCAAAVGRARSSVTVDLSRTYLAWAQHNLVHNGIGLKDHLLVHDDVMAYLAHAARAQQRFDIALINPPSFSNSKRMQQDFDVWQDHGALIEATMAVVRRGGWALFSSHAQRFKLDDKVAERFCVRQVHSWVRPSDFRRPARGAQAFLIAHAP